MKKVDSLALSISFILNLLILFLIPGMSPKEVAGKIKVGLVSLESKKNVNYSGKKEVEAKPPVTPPKKEEVQPVQEKKETPQVVEKKPNLSEIAISQPKIDVLSKKGIQAPKPEFSNPSSAAQSSQEKVMEIPLEMKGNEDGVPSGYKLGALDGDITATWNPNNRDPEYPVSAQNRGLNGRVTLRLTIDGAGNITRVILQRRSGVPEIDLAIEKVAKSWKINLTKNGAPAKGDVILEYDFKLTGN